MKTISIKNAHIVNRGQVVVGDLYIRGGRIEQVGGAVNKSADREIDAGGLYAIPGIIDDQVHFREPGLTHKASIQSEARAAVAGGVTTYMEMPNTRPPALTQSLLEEKYAIAAKRSLANYSFFMGVSNENLEEVLRTDKRRVCGIKIFMGSSTGNMLVDRMETLEAIFSRSPMLIATHCEDEHIIRRNEEIYRSKYGEAVPMYCHPLIRNEECCLKSSSLAIDLARKHGSRLHILHISTAEELALFRNDVPLADKRITSEVCVHHLYFNSEDYERKGAMIKCNPAIKEARHQEALLAALLDDRLDIIATDHAPHTWEEKQGDYFGVPSGVPLVQHSLNIMLTFHQAGKITLEKVVEKMCHAPAECFRIVDRGYLDEGKWADIALVDLGARWEVSRENLHYRCGWSPFEGDTFQGRVVTTIVSGHIAYERGDFSVEKTGERLMFEG